MWYNVFIYIYAIKGRCKELSYGIMEYMQQNYMTLLLLASLSMLLLVNRKMKIQGLHYVWTIIVIVFIITLCEALEDICDAYDLSYRILYYKTALIYLLYPLAVLLELVLVTEVKNKLLVLVPYAVSSVIALTDLSDTRIIYYFDEYHNYHGGPLSLLPVAVICCYVVLLGFGSVKMLKQGYKSKGIIVLFMTVTTIIGAVGEQTGFARGFTEATTAIEMLLYYFFLSAINFSETQTKLYNSRLELEQQRNKLLVMQIQPHFVFNSLATIQSLCYTDSEKAADCIDVFGDYLRANINSLSSDEFIEFSSELEHIKQYVSLEKAGTDVDFKMIYDLETKDFLVPPLTVQPVVENAIKHGALTRRDGTGFVKIKTEEFGGMVRIIITDNGTGAALTNKQKEHQSVGIKNVRQRLEILCGGTLDTVLSDNGAESVITIPAPDQ